MTVSWVVTRAPSFSQKCFLRGLKGFGSLFKVFLSYNKSLPAPQRGEHVPFVGKSSRIQREEIQDSQTTQNIFEKMGWQHCAELFKQKLTK